MTSSGGYTVEVVKEIDGVLALRNSWEPMPVDPNADLDFYLAVIQSRQAVVRPHVIVLKQNGVIENILVGRIEDRPFDIALGYKKLSLPGVRFLTLVHGGDLGAVSEAAASVLAKSVQNSLKKREADVALFHGMDTDSALHRVVRKSGGAFTRDFYPEVVERWRIRVPRTYEELYRKRSSNTRHNVKRYSKRLRDAFGEQLTVRTLHTPSDMKTMLSDSEAIASRTYHRGLGVGFVDDSLTRQLMSLGASKGWLRAHILYIAGKPVAFWNGFLYRRTFFTWTTGYDPELSKFRPGTFLLQRVLADLCSEGSADEVDFGFGDAQYKQDWSDYCRPQVSQFLFSPSAKGVLLNCFRSPLVGASNAARALLLHTGALQKIRRAWRARLSK